MSRQESDLCRAKQQELASSLVEKELQITSLEGRLNDSELQLTIKTEVGCTCVCVYYASLYILCTHSCLLSPDHLLPSVLRATVRLHLWKELETLAKRANAAQTELSEKVGSRAFHPHFCTYC